MFCGNCGQAIEEGRRFCKNCGAPAPADAGGVAPTGPEAGLSTGAWADDLDATAVRWAVDGGAPPPTAGAAPPSAYRSAAPVPPGAEGMAGGGGGGYGTGWPAPQGPGPKGGRTGLVVGSVAAAIVVLAGLGVGLYFGLRDDGGGTTDTTKVAVSTTKTTGSDITSGGTSTTGSGIGTTETIPDLTSATEGSTTTTAGSTTTTVTMTTDPADLLGDWYEAEAALAVELESDDTRIPELADAINSTAPDVPDLVYDELSGMLDRLAALGQTMDETPVPEGYEDAHHWLMEAFTHMSYRIQATMDGIAIMWSSGSVDAATPNFNKGRTERDAYREAIDKHWNALPSG